MKRFIRGEAGASVVELAVMLPLFALFLIGIVEIGRFTALAIMASNAARAGAQYGAQNLTTAMDLNGMDSAAAGDAQNLSNWTPTANYLCSVNGGALEQCPSSLQPKTVYYVKVQVTGTFKSLLDYPALPKQLPVSGSAIMRVADQ